MTAIESELKSEREISLAAILSVVLGLAGIVTFGLSAVLGLVLGIVASWRISRSERRLSGQGFATAGMVISVIVLGFCLETVITFGSFGSKEKVARLRAAEADVKNYATALDLFELDNGFYPTTEQGLQALITQPSVAPAPINWKGPYRQTQTLRPDPWGQPYVYKCPGTRNTNSFDLYSAGPNRIYGDNDDVIFRRQ